MEIRDPVFADAVAALDAGDIPALKTLLAAHPRLLTERLITGEQGYFANPYLLWFVAENPVRNGRLPSNIVDVAGAIVDALDQCAPPSRRQQISYAVELTATGRVAREAGAQIALIDLLVARGAVAGGLDGAVAHGEREAARRLLHHGAVLTLTAAIGLELKADMGRLLPSADPGERADALVVAAGLGLKPGMKALLDAGVDPNIRSQCIHPHATALHQAALTGDHELCEMLLAAGALTDVRDTIWHGAPSDWANHAGHDALARLLTSGR